MVTVQAWTVDPATGALVAPDPGVPDFTGHLQQWFGGSFNHSNFVTHDTINLKRPSSQRELVGGELSAGKAVVV
jgi:hypothetical protein